MNRYRYSMSFILDASGNPVTQAVVSVTDSNGNPVTGNSNFKDNLNCMGMFSIMIILGQIEQIVYFIIKILFHNL